MAKSFEWPVRVYYEDTDAGGIVYYANYLKFMERARTELLRAEGLDQVKLRDELGVLLVVRHVEADYRRSALYDDELLVKTELVEMKNASMVLSQDVWRGDEQLFAGKVVIVAMNLDGRSTRIPAEIRAKFE